MKKHATTTGIILMLLVCTAPAFSNDTFFDLGYSGSSEQCLIDISTSLANELGIKQAVAEAQVQYSLKLRKDDLGPYVGSEQYQGKIRPDAILDNFSKRKILWADYHCKEMMKVDSESGVGLGIYLSSIGNNCSLL